MNPFKVNYSDLEKVIEYAKSTGWKRVVVYKDGDKFDIAHAERVDKYQPKDVVWKNCELPKRCAVYNGRQYFLVPATKRYMEILDKDNRYAREFLARKLRGLRGAETLKQEVVKLVVMGDRDSALLLMDEMELVEKGGL